MKSFNVKQFYAPGQHHYFEVKGLASLQNLLSAEVEEDRDVIDLTTKIQSCANLESGESIWFHNHTTDEWFEVTT